MTTRFSAIDLLIDASTQFGKTYLVSREDRFRFPTEAAFDPEVVIAADLHASFETRVMPLSTVGAGCASTTKKSVNVASMYLNESQDEEAFDKKRKQVRGGTTDQGVEAHILDATINIIPRFCGRYSPTSILSFLFPYALFIPGHLHLLYTALEEACKQLAIAETFFKALQSICRFLGGVDLRREFQISCADDACRSKFNHCPRHHIDWRWEFLSRAIVDVLRLWPDLVRCWSLSAMQASEAGKLSAEILKDLDAIVKDPWWLIGVGLMFCAMGCVVDKFAHKLEGCHCHKEVDRET